MRKRVVICDDHEVFAQALAVALESPTLAVVAAITDPAAAARTVLEHEADVLVLDLAYPSGSGLPYIGEVRNVAPECRVVVLSGYSEETSIEAALDAGADAYAAKTDALPRIAEIIERGGGGYRTPAVTVENSRAHRSTDRERPLVTQFLTDRETEVLARLIRGQETRAMADEMGITYATARTHIQNVITKLGVHSRLEAVAFAIRHGLVDPEEPEDLLAS